MIGLEGADPAQRAALYGSMGSCRRGDSYSTPTAVVRTELALPVSNRA